MMPAALRCLPAATFNPKGEDTVMGELKELRTQQETLVERAREINRKVWLAGLGVVGKAEEEGRRQLDRYVSAGEKALGDEGAETNRYLVAARGLVATLREEGDELLNKLVDAGRRQRGETEEANDYLLALIGAVSTLRDESQKLFDDLVATGEKRQHQDERPQA
jgi:polyhydroxyalkanoate synthesis regulator phasin